MFFRDTTSVGFADSGRHNGTMFENTTIVCVLVRVFIHEINKHSLNVMLVEVAEPLH
jgi:hypothetical protein